MEDIFGEGGRGEVYLVGYNGGIFQTDFHIFCIEVLYEPCYNDKWRIITMEEMQSV